MKIQFNTDSNIKGDEVITSHLEEIILEKLTRFSDQITRIEVHLSDENADKNSPNDKRCVLEARLKGLKPMAVTDNSSTQLQAVEGAIDKLKALLDSSLGRLSNHC